MAETMTPPVPTTKQDIDDLIFASSSDWHSSDR